MPGSRWYQSRVSIIPLQCLRFPGLEAGLSLSENWLPSFALLSRGHRPLRSQRHSQKPEGQEGAHLGSSTSSLLGLPSPPPLQRLSWFLLHGLCSMKGKSSRLRNATGVQLWQHSQRPLQDLQLWRALGQRFLDVTASLPDLPSIHTFLPQIEVTVGLPVPCQGNGRCSWERVPAKCGISVTLTGKGLCLGRPSIWEELTAPAWQILSLPRKCYQQQRSSSVLG